MFYFDAGLVLVSILHSSDHGMCARYVCLREMGMDGNGIRESEVEGAEKRMFVTVLCGYDAACTMCIRTDGSSYCVSTAFFFLVTK